MSETYRPPNADERIVETNGTSTEQTRRLLSRITGMLNGSIPNNLVYYTYYADLADLNTKLPNPQTGQEVMVTGQGKAIYNESNTWVLSSDDSTPII